MHGCVCAPRSFSPAYRSLTERGRKFNDGQCNPSAAHASPLFHFSDVRSSGVLHGRVALQFPQANFTTLYALFSAFADHSGQSLSSPVCSPGCLAQLESNLHSTACPSHPSHLGACY
eukprot:114805-Pelagomonas_calceolata.AAC.1